VPGAARGGGEVGVAIPFAGVEWSQVFTLDKPILEIFVRGTVTYLGLFALLRLTLKRQSGTVGITDLLVIVLIADAAQNAMSAEYTSIADGFVLVSTILFWSFALDWLGHHSRLVERFVHPPPLQLVRKGMTQIRKQGSEDLEGVEAAYMEADGTISVICSDQKKANHAPERKPV
jgi:uncharacterized membrane protein YcaP (DUF421 family)